MVTYDTTSPTTPYCYEYSVRQYNKGQGNMNSVVTVAVNLSDVSVGHFPEVAASELS
jgi:hypothetical protein